MFLRYSANHVTNTLPTGKMSNNNSNIGTCFRYFRRKLTSCRNQSRTFSKRAIFIFLILLFTYLLYSDSFLRRRAEDLLGTAQLSTLGSSATHFEFTQARSQLLINTTHCKIPEFLPWSKSGPLLEKKCTKYFWEAPQCEEKERHAWTYLNGSYIFVNMTAVKESGYSQNSIRCCYRVISRVEQSLENYDMMADRRIKYSKECHPITIPKQHIKEEFIRVFCMSTSIPLINDVVSRQFFAIAQTDAVASKKISKWKQLKDKDPEHEPPPNVIILGLDTMSRLNAYRNFNQTLSLLKSIGAIEIEGYTKVGETTFPNTVAFMSGNTLGELTQYCYESVRVPQDYCPYLWKAYDKVGYLTATLEDVPLGTSFNFLKAGFVHKPTDFFLRPLMLAVMKHLPRENNWYVRCLGKYMIEEVILNYTSDLLERASSGTPVFVHIWLAVMAHDCSLSAKYVDPHLHNFLQRVDKENTIIMFMGDHGEVFGPFRETVQGWYEDKLPTLWVYLPPRLRTRFPEWVTSLHINSKRLTSHFDMYKTLVHILKTFDKDRKAEETYSRTIIQHGQSLLEPVREDRSCADAGIPEGYCACSQPQNMDLANPHPTLLKAANTALQYIIKMLPSQCALPTMKEILNAKFFKTPKGNNVYIITFITDPGHFMFEGTVKEEINGKGTTLVVANDVLRMNKIVRKANCISEPLLERYCYCK